MASELLSLGSGSKLVSVGRDRLAACCLLANVRPHSGTLTAGDVAAVTAAARRLGLWAEVVELGKLAGASVLVCDPKSARPWGGPREGDDRETVQALAAVLSSQGANRG